MVTYPVDLKKLMKTTVRFLRRCDVPEHFSKTKNEQYSLHQMLVLCILYCLCDLGIDRFGEQLKITDLSAIGLNKALHYSTLWRAWRRFPPSFLRKLIQLSGRGGRGVQMCPPSMKLYLRCFNTPPTERKIDSVVADCWNFGKKMSFGGVVVIVPKGRLTSIRDLKKFKNTKIGKSVWSLVDKTTHRFDRHLCEIRFGNGTSQIIYIAMFK